MMGWHPPSLRFRKEYSGSRDILQMSRNNSPSYGVSKAKVLQAPPFSIMQHDPCAETGKQLCSVSLVEHERNSALHCRGIAKSVKARDFDSRIRWFESSYLCHYALLAQLAEATGLSPVQSEFESLEGHQLLWEAPKVGCK